MSEFSTLISKYIKERDIKFYPMTQYCNVDRSTMYKIINGKRNPPTLTLVRRMSEFMHLNPAESEALEEAFYLTTIGKEKYYSAKTVVDFISDFSTIRFPYTNTAPAHSHSLSSSSDTETKDAVSSSFPVYGRQAVNQAIFQLLSQAFHNRYSHLSIMAQPSYEYLYELLISFHQHDQDIHIEHIVCLQNSDTKKESLQNYNLLCLKSLLPLFSYYQNYCAYYYYDNISSHFDTLNILPNMMVSDFNAIAFSADFMHAIWYNDMTTVDFFKTYFQKCKLQTAPLMNRYSSLESMYKQILSLSYKDSCFILQAQPCLVPYLSDAMLEKYILPNIPNRQKLISCLSNHIFQLKEKLASADMTHYFSPLGILQFLKTGYLGEVPDSLYTPLDMEDRIILLENYYDDCKKGVYYLLDKKLSYMSEDLHIFATAQNGYLSFRDANKQRVFFTFNEASLLYIFYSFLSDLKGSPFIKPSPETVRYLQHLLQQEKRIHT